MKRLTALCLLFCFAQLRAEIQKSDTKESLRGLTGIFVNTQFIDLTPEGLNTNQVIKFVETDLLNSGIAVYLEPKRAEGFANLSITVNAVKSEQIGAYLFMVQIAVTQTTQLTRIPNAKPVAAQTWTRNIQGLTPPERTDIILDAVKKGVNEFINDFHQMNPKTASPTK
jgi:hypothetical protein